MIRSSSKLITKARSLRNISKSGYRFRYSLRFESVNKLTVGGRVVVVWERGQKVVATEAVRVDTATRVAKFDPKVALAQDVTLFKKKEKSKDFEDKVYRISVKSGGKDGKTIAKIQLDFARYAGIPSSSRRVAAEMSHGGRLIMQIESRFVGEAVSRRKKNKGSQGSKGSKGSKGAVSSVASFVTDNESTFSGDVANVAELDDLEQDDFGDLNLDQQEVPTESRRLRSKGSFKESEDVGSSDIDSRPLNPSVRKKPKGANAKVSSNAPLTSRGRIGFKGPSSSSGATETRLKPVDSEGSTVSKATVQRSVYTGGQGAIRNRVRQKRSEESELENLRQENERLRRRNEELEEAARSGGDHVDKYTLSKLAEENKRLRNEVNELKIQIAREPAYNDVVRDLKEAKMALALLNLEKEELHHQVNTSNRRCNLLQ